MNFFNAFWQDLYILVHVKHHNSGEGVKKPNNFHNFATQGFFEACRRRRPTLSLNSGQQVNSPGSRLHLQEGRSKKNTFAFSPKRTNTSRQGFRGSLTTSYNIYLHAGHWCQHFEACGSKKFRATGTGSPLIER